jgi:hypothetical protein
MSSRAQLYSRDDTTAVSAAAVEKLWMMRAKLVDNLRMKNIFLAPSRGARTECDPVDDAFAILFA